MNRTLFTTIFIAAAIGCNRTPPATQPVPPMQPVQQMPMQQMPMMPQQGMQQPMMPQQGMQQPMMPQQGMQPMMPQQGMMPGMGGGMGMAAPPGQVGMVAVGQTIMGMLQQGDTPLNDGSVGDDYNVMLTAGMPVTIVVRGGPSMTTPGSNLDVYTILLMNGQELTHDDDSAGNLNSRIVWTPTMTGMHTIRVTTEAPSARPSTTTKRSSPPPIRRVSSAPRSTKMRSSRSTIRAVRPASPKA